MVRLAGGEVERAVPASLGVAWSPSRIAPGEAVFGATDGRHYVLNVLTQEVSCVTAPMPARYLPTHFARAGQGWGSAYVGTSSTDGLPAVLLGFVDGEEVRVDRRLVAASEVNSVRLFAIPQRSEVLAVVSRGDEATLLLLGASGARRVGPPILGLNSVDVSDAGLLYSRQTPNTRVIDTPRPPERPRDPRRGCDPVPPGTGGCGWVSNGCEYVFLGHCTQQIAQPDPEDGVYLLPW